MLPAGEQLDLYLWKHTTGQSRRIQREWRESGPVNQSARVAVRVLTFAAMSASVEPLPSIPGPPLMIGE
jgi:hypothetical protein